MEILFVHTKLSWLYATIPMAVGRNTKQINKQT